MESVTEKELERRRKRYKLVLVRWYEPDEEDDYYAIERKAMLAEWGWEMGAHYEVVCDTEPSYVLEGMRKLLKES